MLPLIMDLCKLCAKTKGFKEKLLVRERIVVIRHMLMTEAVKEYEVEIAVGIENEVAIDDYFDLKGFLYDCERSCYECNNSDEARLYLVIKEYLELCHGEISGPGLKKELPSVNLVVATAGQAEVTAVKLPTNLAEYRTKKNR